MSNPAIINVQQSVLSTTAGKCPFCDKSGLMILPLRHSAFCSDDSQAMASVPQVGLGEDFSLDNARLTARMMREGYLYVLVDRGGVLYWKSYFVTASARLYAFPEDSPPSRSIEFSCHRDSDKAETSVVTIENPEQVHNTYWLFSPDPLSKRKRDEYKANAAKFAQEGKLQVFSPANWVAGTREQDHSLVPDALAEWVAEYVALGAEAARPTPLLPPPGQEVTSAMGSELMRQPFCPLKKGPLTSDYASLSLFPWTREALSARLDGPRLHALKDALVKNEGVAFVLRDALGITQELNAWRNAALEGVEPWLNREQDGTSNRWRFQVATRLVEVREDLKQHRIMQAEERIDAFADDERANEVLGYLHPDENKKARDAYIEREVRRAGWHGDTGTYLKELEIKQRAWEVYPDTGKERREAAREQMKQAHRTIIGEEAIERQRQRAAEAAERTFRSLDMEGAERVLSAFDAEAKQCEQVAQSRMNGHLAVLQSAYLLNALYAYDEDDMPRGWAFAIQVALCTLGMEACPAGHAMMTEWWRDVQIKENNLFWRAYGLNQNELLEDLRAALAEAKAQGEVQDVPGVSDVLGAIRKEVKRGKKVIAAFEKANKALDDAEKGLAPLDWFARSQMGVLMGWYAQAAKGIFNTGLPNRADRAMASVLARAMNWRLGRVATQLKLEELAQQADAVNFNRMRGQIRSRVRASVQAELEAGKIGNFYALRIGVIVAVFEATNLWFKGQEFAEGDRQRAEFAAAALGTLAVGLEVMQTGAEWVTRRYSVQSLTHRVAATWGGGLRLYGGFLGATGGVIGAVLDYGSFKEEAKNSRSLLAGAYLLRGVAVLAVSALSLGVALSGSGPYLKMLMQRTGSQALQRMLTVLQALARKLAQRAVLVFMRTWVARIGWVLLAISAIIWLLEPDAMEKWSDKSAFRKDRSRQRKTFENEMEELAELEAAFMQMVSG